MTYPQPLARLGRCVLAVVHHVLEEGGEAAGGRRCQHAEAAGAAGVVLEVAPEE